MSIIRRLFGSALHGPGITRPKHTTYVDRFGVTRGRWIWPETSKYRPHQGARECQRRKRGGFAGTGGW